MQVKVHMILPHLVMMAEKWQEYVDKNNYDERDLFPLYKTIVECTEDAEMEKSIPKTLKLDFFDIELKYRDKMDSLT